MYLEVSGVSKHELGGTQEKLKIKAREHDARSRDEHISACTEYVHFNQEIRDEFEIEGRDAG